MPILVLYSIAVSDVIVLDIFSKSDNHSFIGKVKCGNEDTTTYMQRRMIL
jgi:hypothetical protein